MMLIARRGLRAGGFALATTLLSFAATAQVPPPPGPQPRPQAPAAAPSKAANPPRDSAPGADAALRQRVEQLEEQLVDMQVVVGTLESLARGATAPAASSPGRPGSAAIGAADAGRLDSIETQIRALAAQLEQLQEQMRALGGRSGALAPSSSQAANDPPPAGPRAGRPQLDAGPSQPERTGFGAVTVSPGGAEKDDIDRLLSPPRSRPNVAVAPPPGSPAEADASPKQLYETAYGYLLQRDYGAAESAFDEFLSRFPGDPLAGNAQYWLGESLYVRGQYRAAAGAFLKGYQNYTRSTKAPESLLKLAMSLHRLGQKDAACSSYNELASKYPNVAAHVRNTAQAERQRAGC